MTRKIIALLAACTLISGCNSIKSDGKSEVLLNEDQIQAALANAKPPQQFGFSVYPTVNNGIAMRGSARLHPRHVASAKFISSDLPVIHMNGSAARMTMNALLDPSSTESWFDFEKAQEFKASFLGLDGRTIAYQGNSYVGNIAAYAAVIPQMRINQLFIENSPVFVRMALNSLGPLNRGIQDCKIHSLIGYDILSTFEYVQFDLDRGRVNFSATIAYTPNENRLIGEAAIVRARGIGLAVAGAVGGNKTPIILDVAGNYDFVVNNATASITPMIELGEVVYVNTPTIQSATYDGLPRAGIGMLRKYVVTVCPRKGVVYFERP